MTTPDIEARLSLARELTLLKAYRPRKRRGKRKHQTRRRQIVRKLRRAA